MILKSIFEIDAAPQEFIFVHLYGHKCTYIRAVLVRHFMFLGTQVVQAEPFLFGDIIASKYEPTPLY